jgi:AAHS family 4-hydroxybenzoate transporter-like MFS transporter
VAAIVSTTRDLRRLLDEAPLSRMQLIAIAITALLSGLDGFDIQCVTFAAPAIAKAWGIGKTQLGLVFSSGLVGMAFGSLVVAQAADIWGRRRAIVCALVVMIVGTLLSALSRSVTFMMMSRVLTGLGIGVVMPVIVPLAMEYANQRRRSLTISLIVVESPIAGVAGGLAAAALLPWFGWTAVFYLGTVAALVLLPIVLIGLPESPAYLIGRPGPSSLRRLNDYLLRSGHDTVSALGATDTPSRRGYRVLFSKQLIGATMRVTFSYGIYVLTPFYVLSWLPQMVADAGHSPSTASLVAAFYTFCGVVGGLLLGAAARWVPLRRLNVVAISGAGIATALFGFTPPSLALLTTAAGVCGFLVIAAATALFTEVATAFDAEARASGTGWVFGIGRCTSAVSPALAGWMFSNGFGRGTVSLVFAGCAMAAAIVIAIPRRQK